MKEQAGRLTLVIGGIGSGKSEFAEELIADAHSRSAGGKRFYYFTPAEAPGDEEMRMKIRAHRERRPGWLQTVECGVQPEVFLSLLNRNDVVLFDSAGTLAGRLVMDKPAAPSDEIIDTLRVSLIGFVGNVLNAGASLVIVTEDVGQSLVAENESGRKFQKVMGRLNRLLAAESERVYQLTAGIPVRLK